MALVTQPSTVRKILTILAGIVVCQIVYFGFIEVRLALLLFNLGGLLFLYSTYRYPELFLIKSSEELDPYVESIGRDFNFWLGLALMAFPVILWLRSL